MEKTILQRSWGLDINGTFYKQGTNSNYAKKQLSKSNYQGSRNVNFPKYSNEKDCVLHTPFCVLFPYQSESTFTKINHTLSKLTIKKILKNDTF